jgi:outer membrane protein TolC
MPTSAPPAPPTSPHCADRVLRHGQQPARRAVQVRQRRWSFGPGLSLPLFDGGRRDSALALAEVRQQQALVAYDQAVQGAFRDVADALAAQRGLSDQVQTLTRMLAVQNERARLAQLRYDAGAVRYLEVLDAERDRSAPNKAWCRRRPC